MKYSFQQKIVMFWPIILCGIAIYDIILCMAGKRKTPVLGAPPRRVVVALRMAGIAGQDKLNGIFDYLSAGRRWQLIIYRTKHEFTPEVVEHELMRGTDGFIVGIPGTEDALSLLAKSDVPTVVMNVSGGGIEKREDGIAFVKSDSTAVGREAANALLKQGVYKSYGYAGYRTFKVSRSLLELRFRQLQGESVYEAMLRVRFEEVKRRLRQTNDPIAEITAACGWENPTPPKSLFKKKFGMSMRDYRAQNAQR